jgi:hypothetical protein
LPPVGDPIPVVSGTPGEYLNLNVADLTVTPALARVTTVLTDGVTNLPVETVYFRGQQGQVARPGHPILPLEIRNVTNAAGVVRGVGFRGGDYVDEPGVQPHTSVPAVELAGSHPVFYSPVFYPIQPWQLNYFDFLADPVSGTIRLATTPVQFKSAAPGSVTGVMRRYSSMDFRLYYSRDKSAAALAAPPTIAHVATSILTSETGSLIQFRIEVNSSHEIADVQEVWITWSTAGGSQWQSLDLVRSDANPILWEGQLSSTEPEALLFMVQAASGAGLVTLDTNHGAYYTPGVVPGVQSLPTLAGETAPASTQINWLAAPVAGAFAGQATFAAQLTSGGAPLVGEVLNFALGAQKIPVVTGADGSASATFLLSDKPGELPVTVAFAGTPAYAPIPWQNRRRRSNWRRWRWAWAAAT